jgi:hypothetical protein
MEVTDRNNVYIFRNLALQNIIRNFNFGKYKPGITLIQHNPNSNSPWNSHCTPFNTFPQSLLSNVVNKTCSNRRRHTSGSLF